MNRTFMLSISWRDIVFKKAVRLGVSAVAAEHAFPSPVLQLLGARLDVPRNLWSRWS